MNTLDKLKKMTVVVADTGDIDSIKEHTPRDATTNPSLLLAAAQKQEYRHLVDDALAQCSKNICNPSTDMRPCIEKLTVNFASEILKVVPKRVSVEVDATLSFDTNETIKTAKRIIAMFENRGINRSKILIKIASTWEGIKAAEQLEKENIHCNLTLLFSFAQAVACAEANVTLISPFLGRIMDWYKEKQKVEYIHPQNDPGVASVKQIYNYYKQHGYNTEIMGASFRNVGEIKELAGCDLLTISPKLLSELENENENLERKLSPNNLSPVKKIHIDEKQFRWMLNEDAMATEKLAEGIRKFAADLQTLSVYMRKLHCQ